MEKDQPSVIMPNVSSSEDDDAQEDGSRESTLERDDHDDGFQEVKIDQVTNRQKKYKDGSIYTGDFLGDKRHGNGKLIFPDGGIYEGEWLDDHPHGYGERRHPDGSMYKGQFVKGIAEGYGEFSHGERGLYIGQWK